MMILSVPQIVMYSRYLKEWIKEVGLARRASATLGETNVKRLLEKHTIANFIILIIVRKPAAL